MAIPLKKERVYYLYICHLALRKAAHAIVKLFDRRHYGGLVPALKIERKKLQELIDDGKITETQLKIVNELIGK